MDRTWNISVYFKWAKYTEFGTELVMLCMNYWHLLRVEVYDLDYVRFDAEFGFRNRNVIRSYSLPKSVFERRVFSETNSISVYFESLEVVNDLDLINMSNSVSKAVPNLVLNSAPNLVSHSQMFFCRIWYRNRHPKYKCSPKKIRIWIWKCKSRSFTTLTLIN